MLLYLLSFVHCTSVITTSGLTDTLIKNYLDMSRLLHRPTSSLGSPASSAYSISMSKARETGKKMAMDIFESNEILKNANSCWYHKNTTQKKHAIDTLVAGVKRLGLNYKKKLYSKFKDVVDGYRSLKELLALLKKHGESSFLRLPMANMTFLMEINNLVENTAPFIAIIKNFVDATCDPEDIMKAKIISITKREDAKLKQSIIDKLGPKQELESLILEYKETILKFLGHFLPQEIEFFEKIYSLFGA